MTLAIISILGIYNLYPDIFEGFEVPDHISRQAVIETILWKCSELELLYSRPETLKGLITIWTKTYLPEWKALQDTLEYDYNPIWNVDGTETETETRNLKTVNAGELKQSVKGFNDSNADDYANKAKDESSGQSDYTGTITRVKNRGGNIGVTMTQQLIQAQRDVVQFNVTDVIIKSFKNNFCILVY